MYDNISLQEGKEKIIKGIKKTTSVIKGTYGAAGGNVVVEHPYYPFFATVNDGKTIVDAIKLADPIEQIGAHVIKEAGDLADKLSGDGRKTTMLLVEAIFDEAAKVEGLPMEIKKSLSDCVPGLLESIKEQSRPITVDDIKSVATISSESEELGQLIQDAYKQIGPEGIIEVDTSNLPETFYEIGDGVRLRGARCFPHSWTELGQAVCKNPLILIVKDKINTSSQLEPILQYLKGKDITELVIYLDDIDISVVSKLARTHYEGGFKTILIKSPTLWKDWFYEDLAAMTGATPIDATTGKTFKNVTFQDLGTCERIVSTSEETRIIGIKDISSHIKLLEEKSLTDDQQKLRLSWLNTKTAILKVGANSDTELHHKMKKAKDACHSSYLALKEGIVPGGGIALRNAAQTVFNLDNPGGKILGKALLTPFKQIIANAGIDYDEFMKTKNQKDEFIAHPNLYGFNAKTGEMVDMFDAGIVDAALVIKNAIINSVSIASTVITTLGVITLPEEVKSAKINGNL